MPRDLPAQLVHILVRVMLAGDHHSGDPVGLAVLVLHGHLGLAVRPQALDGPGFPGVGQQQGQPVGQRHGQGQQLRRLRTGKAIHDALVSSAHLGLLSHSAGDIAALVMGDDLHLIVRSIASFPNSPAHDSGDVRQLGGGDLPGHDDLPRGGHDLAGHAGGGVVAQTGVQDAVGNGVAQLVRVALGDRLCGQDAVIFHSGSPFSSFVQMFHAGSAPGIGADRSPGTGCPCRTWPGPHGECRTARRCRAAPPCSR